jgi:hypothetical protein
MAPKTKKEEGKEMASKAPGRKIIEVYVVPMKKFAFLVKSRDPQGNFIPLIDPMSRVQKLMEDGTPIYIEKTIQFENIVNNVQKGCLSQYIVYEDTPAEIAERLAELHDDGRSSVMTREEWIREKNPDHYNEIQRRKSLESELEAKYIPVIEKQNSAIDDMQKKIDELTSLLEANTK